MLSWSARRPLRAVCLVLNLRLAGLPFGGLLYVPRGPFLDYDLPEAPQVLSSVLDRLARLARGDFAVVRNSPDVKQTTAWVQKMLEEKSFHPAKQPISHTVAVRLDLTQPLNSLVAGMERGRLLQKTRV